MAGKPKYYWDACVFFAWLNDEASIHGSAVIDGISEMAKDYDDNKIVLMSSLMTKTEVFDYKLTTQWARDEFSLRFQRDNFTWILQDERVSDKSRWIRNFHGKRDGITLDATDCVHLASAIMYKADVFYTLDGNAQNPKPNALLPLNGDVAGHPLRIEVPHCQQGSLFSGIPKTVSSAIKSRRQKSIAPRPGPRVKRGGKPQ